ncbi:MAG: hypothetical protein PVI90_03215 [Desulfobacteraceae bacterium]|jgi:hypothetical protein
MQLFIGRILIFFLVVTVLGCTTAIDPKPETKTVSSFTIPQSKAMIEKLDSNHKQLIGIYQDMQIIAEGDLFYGSDEQLCTIQKSNLYILLSTRTVRYQKQLLSMMDNIDTKNRQNYLSMLTKELKQAVFDSAADLNFLNTYYAFIENETAQENIDTAVTLIRDNMNIYKRLITISVSSTDKDLSEESLKDPGKK